MNFVTFAGSDATAVLFVAALSSTGLLGTSVAAGGAAGRRRSASASQWG